MIMVQPGEENKKSQFKLLFEENGNDNLYEKITDFFPAIIYVYDSANEKLGYVNKQIKEVLGYSLDDVKGWDGDMMKMVFSDDVEIVKKELTMYGELQDDLSHSFQCRFNHRDDNFHYFKVKGTVLKRDPAGKPTSLLFVAQDVSHEKISEQESAASKSLIRDSEELLQYGTWRLDISTGKMNWSEGMYALLGYNSKEPVTPELEFLLQHIDVGSKTEFKDMVENPETNRSGFERTFDLITAGGEVKRVSTKTRLVKSDNGKALSLLGLTWDVTTYYNLYRDLLNYKNMVRDKEMFLRSGSWEYDALARTTEWSDGMYNLLGYDPLPARTLAKTNQFHFNHQSQEEVTRELADWDKEADGNDHFTREVRITMPDGSLKMLESFGKIIRNKDKEVVKVLGTTRDITKLKEYESKLEAKVAELARSNKELEEFAYVASHDLQEPLRKITTFSERISSRFSEKLGKDGKDYIDRMVHATENMRILIENLLEFSRTTRDEFLFEKTDLNQTLSDATKDLELKLEETQGVINSNTLPLVEVVPSQIKQLFINLIANAIKFVRPGVSPVIQISSEPVSQARKSELKLQTDSDYESITVTDNGIGFDQEYAEAIFKIFQRLHGKSEYPGSGIGLAICKKIIDHHKGVIYAESQRGQGSKFTFILPQKQFG